jgi:TPR repeat protein
MTPIPALSVREAKARDIAVDFEALLPACDWDGLERSLSALREAGVDRVTQADYTEGLDRFCAYAVTRGTAALEDLRLWCQARPSSTLPAILEVLYWSAWFGEYRGTGLAHEVEATGWACAHVAQDAMFCALFRLLAVDARAWPAVRSTFHSIAAVGEPDWCAAWLLQGERPQAMPTHRETEGAAALLTRSGANAYDQRLPEALPAPLVGEALAWRRSMADEEPVPLQYWLRVTFEMDSCALEAAAFYVNLRMPRWGGSLQEMLDFVDLPLCARFNETDRNVLRFFAWYDELEVDSYLLADSRVARNQLKVGEKVLKRPLPENLRGRVHKYMAYLHAKLEQPGKACEHYALSAPHNHFEPWEVSRAIDTWMQGSPGNPWLGRMAEVNRLITPEAAALYGLLCERGWAGVEKKPEVAEGWYERAAALSPDLSHDNVSSNSPFLSLDPLRQLEGDAAFLPMWLKAAELGDASSQFLCGYHFQTAGGDRDRALHWYRQAAANRHDMAMRNIVVLQMKGMREGKITGPQADEAAKDVLLQLDDALQRLLAHQDELHSFSRDNLDAIKRSYGHLLIGDEFPRFAREAALPRVLEFGHAGHVDSMISLAWWYADEDVINDGGADYEQAVRWTEAARHADPDHERLEALIGTVRKDSIWQALRYRLVLRKVKREGLPAQSA